MNFYLAGKRDGHRVLRWRRAMVRALLLLILGPVLLLFFYCVSAQTTSAIRWDDAFRLGWLFIGAALLVCVVVPLVMPLFVSVERLPALGPEPESKRVEIPFARLFSWAMVRRYLFIVAALVTLAALFYAEENWRGKRAWDRYCQQMSAKGVKLEPAEFVPPPVPDAENFAKTPFLAPLFDLQPAGQWPESPAYQQVDHVCEAYHNASQYPLVHQQRFVSTWTKEPTDLQAWYAAFYPPPRASEPSVVDEAYLRRYGTPLPNSGKVSPPLVRTNLQPQQAAAGILAALDSCKAVLEEVRQNSRRPRSRFNISYDWQPPSGIILPHLSPLRKLCHVLQLRASTELALGQTNEACEDVLLIIRLSDMTQDEPFVISYLIRTAMLQLALQPIAEGVAEAKWSEAQLLSFQHALRRIDFLADGLRAIQADRAFVIGGEIDYLLHNPGRALAEAGGWDSPAGFEPAIALMNAFPRGWFHLERLNGSRLTDEALSALNMDQRRIHLGTLQKAQQAKQKAVNRPWPVLFLSHYALAGRLDPDTDRLLVRISAGQTAVDTASVACALERYRLARGSYPNALEALVPDFLEKLPKDIITGEPLKYRVPENRRPVIYSVGWNQKDDGGTPGFKKAEVRPDVDEGDWVWKL